jgi:hypothetical protein
VKAASVSVAAGCTSSVGSAGWARSRRDALGSGSGRPTSGAETAALVRQSYALQLRRAEEELARSGADGTAEWCVGLHGTEEVPSVSLEVDKHGYPSVGFDSRRGDEFDAGSEHPFVRRREVTHPQEEADATRKLLPDDPYLKVPVRASQQDAGRGAAGSHDDPALGAAVVRERRLVFHEIEPQHAHEEIDRRFVLSNDEGNELEVRHVRPVLAIVPVRTTYRAPGRACSVLSNAPGQLTLADPSSDRVHNIGRPLSGAGRLRPPRSAPPRAREAVARSFLDFRGLAAQYPLSH